MILQYYAKHCPCDLAAKNHKFSQLAFNENISYFWPWCKWRHVASTSSLLTIKVKYEKYLNIYHCIFGTSIECSD